MATTLDILRAALWSGLGGAALVVGLAWVVEWRTGVLRKSGFVRRLPARLGWSLLGGAAAGALGQGVFHLLLRRGPIWMPEWSMRSAGLAAIGAGLGWVASKHIPHLARRDALIAGLVAAAPSALLFGALAPHSEPGARLAAGALIGAAIGFCIDIPEKLVRKARPVPVVTLGGDVLTMAQLHLAAEQYAVCPDRLVTLEESDDEVLEGAFTD